jgi:hypothetical protein
MHTVLYDVFLFLIFSPSLSIYNIIGFISAFEICHPINCHTDENNDNNNDNNNNNKSNNNNEAVVSQINSRNDKPSSTESATIIAPLHYVTHKNHRDQEVGVDHIFIRPMISSSSSSNNSHISGYKDTDKTQKNASEKSNIDHSSHDDDSSSTTTTTTAILTTTSTTTLSTTTSTTTTIDTRNQESDDKNNEDNYNTNNTETSLKSSHNSQSNLSEIASTSSSISSIIEHDSIPPYRIFVNTSQVLPTHLTCHYWKDDFHISDHRPIKTNIILMKNK